MGVGIAAEREAPRPITLGDEPDLAGAAAHLIGLGVLGLGQRRQPAAEIDQMPIALLPIAQQVEFVGEFVDGGLDAWMHGLVHGLDLGARRGPGKQDPGPP